MLIKAENIQFSYADNALIFEHLNFSLKAGEIISVVGPSGAGKSTLLKCLAGLLQLSDGKIWMEGERLWGPEDILVAGHPEIAIVNQLFQLDLFFTVRENIGNRLHHLSDEVRKEFVEELLDVFELQDIADHSSQSISGGEKQRLSMACALAKEPKVLLLDEPFVHFDMHLNDKIGNYIRALTAIREMGVVLVTHNGEEALSWSDKIWMMRKGKFTNKYTPKSAYQCPKTLYEGRFFGELNSVYKDGKQILFRPTAYQLKPFENSFSLTITWLYSRYRGRYYANYCKLENGRTVVLYSDRELKDVTKMYVQEK